MSEKSNQLILAQKFYTSGEDVMVTGVLLCTFGFLFSLVLHRIVALFFSQFYLAVHFSNKRYQCIHLWKYNAIITYYISYNVFLSITLYSLIELNKDWHTIIKVNDPVIYKTRHIYWQIDFRNCSAP